MEIEMKAIEILQLIKQINNNVDFLSAIDEAIEEIENMEAKLKQGQDNYDKLWDMYSELKKKKGVTNDTRS